MTDRETMLMALETAEQIACADYRHGEELASLGEFEKWARSRANHIAEALRTALAQPEPEPFGIWHQGDTDEESDFFLYKDAGDVACETCVKLYAEPKRREWVWLTISEVVDCYGNGTAAELGVAHRIQAMAKEKNHG